jgi:DNA-binding Lrp family transcriptional regulator
MPNDEQPMRGSRADEVDRRLLAALVRDPWATQLALADASGTSRNTVRSRLDRYREGRGMRGLDHAIDPAFLGYRLRAFVFTTVEQRRLDEVAAALARVPEVLEVNGLSGEVDLLVEVVAKDGDDLYRVAGAILDIRGVERTSTNMVMRPLVPYRARQLLQTGR